MNICPRPKGKHTFQVLFYYRLPTAVSLSARRGFCQSSAARFGHSGEDEEEAAHRPNSSNRQHHSHPHVWRADRLPWRSSNTPGELHTKLVNMCAENCKTRDLHGVNDDF